MSIGQHVAALLILLAAEEAAKAEAGLYDAPVPPNSAFVRMIDASGGADPVAALDDIDVDVPAGGISPYMVVPAGARTVRFSGASVDVPLKAGTFSTVVVGGSSPRTFGDEAVRNPARAGLYFYNLSNEPVSLLATVKGKSVPVFERVAAGAAAFREVNAFDVELAVVGDGGAVVGPLPSPVTLERRNGVSVVYFGRGSGAAGSAIAERNSVQR
jgi:hypothetical protein